MALPGNLLGKPARRRRSRSVIGKLWNVNAGELARRSGILRNAEYVGRGGRDDRGKTVSFATTTIRNFDGREPASDSSKCRKSCAEAAEVYSVSNFEVRKHARACTERRMMLHGRSASGRRESILSMREILSS